MTTNELIKLLKQRGCYLIEHGSRHDRWFSPITNRDFMVPRHGSQEVAVGTANSILKSAGLK